jgi:alkylated DNA repair dioxygenase AlkB
VAQLSLFEESHPEGLRYQPSFIGADEEDALAERMAQLPFQAFEFHGFEGKRRTVSFGWRYVFDGSGLREAGPIPDWLLPLRARAAALANLAASAFEHVLVTEYAPGAGTGRSSQRWSAFRCSPRRGCASGARRARNGSGRRWSPSRARPTS